LLYDFDQKRTSETWKNYQEHAAFMQPSIFDSILERLNRHVLISPVHSLIEIYSFPHKCMRGEDADSWP